MAGASKRDVLVVGAAGNLGARLVARGLAQGHRVTALVRNEAKFRALVPDRSDFLRVFIGDASHEPTLIAALKGQHALINAAGNVTQGQAFVSLFDNVITSAERAQDFGGRIWALAGIAALKISGTERLIADLPFVPKIYQAHVIDGRRIAATNLDWSLMCPGPMIEGAPGQPRADLRVSRDVSPIGDAWSRVPSLVQSIFIRMKLGEVIVRYDDIADIIMANLELDGPLSRRRVGVALPTGERGQKLAWKPASNEASDKHDRRRPF